MPTYTAEAADNGGRRQGVLTAFFIVLAVILVSLPSGSQQQIAALVRATVLRPFTAMQVALDRARVRATRSAELQADLDSMTVLSLSRTDLVDENRRLRALLSLSGRVGDSWIAASVIRAGTRGSESTFQLSVGSDQGVEVNAPIMTRHGLVGLVREVRSGSAMGMDWTHPDFRASAMSGAEPAYGLVETRRGAFREEDRLQFTGTAFYTSLDPGTTVLTSGRGGVYPRGIPIGRIVEVAEEDAGWQRSYWLEPMVDPAQVTHVLVATGLRTLAEDVSAAWPPDSVLTDAELHRLEEERVDSLRLLRDSVEGLRERIRELTAQPDSGLSPADTSDGSTGPVGGAGSGPSP